MKKAVKKISKGCLIIFITILVIFLLIVVALNISFSRKRSKVEKDAIEQSAICDTVPYIMEQPEINLIDFYDEEIDSIHFQIIRNGQLRDKRRLKFFLYIVAIGMPILIISALAINYFDTKSMAKGYDNEKGGKTYMYRENSGIDKFPEPIAALIAMYPESATTYINVSTDRAGNIAGNIYSFTKDDFSKVIDFYKSAGNIINQSEDRLTLDKNGTEIIIAKEKVYDSDPVQGQTKFNIFFPEKKQ